ncbi:MAG TPA: hypothetical protein VF789_05815 [Thermoanaerobaculia bacterium]
MLEKLSRPRPLRAVLTLAAAVLVSAAVLLPVRVEAVCYTYFLIDYFFDAAKTQYAGTCVRACNGVYSCSGTTTIYRIVESEPCGCS